MRETTVGPFRIMINQLPEHFDRRLVQKFWVDEMNGIARSLFAKHGVLRPAINALALPGGMPPMMLTIDLGDVLGLPNGSRIIADAVPRLLASLNTQVMVLATEIWTATAPASSTEPVRGPVHDMPNRKEALMFQVEWKGSSPQVLMQHINRDEQGKPSLDENVISSSTYSGTLSHFLMPEGEPS